MRKKQRKKRKRKKREKGKKINKMAKHGKKLANCRSSHQVTKIRFLGSVDNAPSWGLIKGFLWVSSQWCPVRSEQKMDQTWLPSIFPSIRVFSNESALCVSWPKYWSFSFNISPSNEYPGLIAFRMDWLDLLAVQGSLKSLLQQHSSNASILWHSAFFKSNSHIHTWLLEKP